MGKIGYGYGSEWHLLRYLGYHRKVLSETVIDLIYPGEDKKVEWLDFKFSGNNEPFKQDQELEGLEFLSGKQDVMDKWKTFWPQSGTSQNWDAVGWIAPGENEELLLVEAKAYLGETRSSCGASEESKEIILAALEKTRKELGGNQPIENWLNQYYQYANRLAVLYFFMKESKPSINCHMLFINFYGDKRPNNIKCPQGKEEWEDYRERIHTSLGIDENSKLMKRVHHLLLPVHPKVDKK